MARPSPEIIDHPVRTHSREYDYYGSLVSQNIITNMASVDGIAPLQRSYTGVVTPGFVRKGKKKRGVVPNKTLQINPYYMQITRTRASGYHSSAFQSWSGETFYVDVTSAAKQNTARPFDMGFDTGLADANNRAFQDLGEKASAVKFNAAQFFGERKQTANLIASNSVRVVEAALALKRGRLKDFITSLSLAGDSVKEARSSWKHVVKTPPEKRIATWWLEYVYGWQPLIMDIWDASELLADRLLDPDPMAYEGRLEAKGHAVRTSRQLRSSGWAFSGQTKFVNKVRYIAHYRLESDGRRLLSQTGISNPLLLGWELLPFSFVVDWFLPVGNYLESLTTFDGFDLVDGSYSRRQEAVSDRFFNVTQTQTNGSFFNSSGWSSMNDFIYQRSRMSGWPSYVLRVKSPIPKEPRDRFFTAMSLLTVLFGRSSGSGSNQSKPWT